MGLPSTEEIAAFQKDGATVVRGLMDMDWVERLRDGVAENLENPGPMASVYTDDGATGRFFGDYCNWSRIDAYEAAFRHSNLGEAAARLMGSEAAFLFHEHVLVKEPGTQEYTPWHQDQPYYVAEGEQVVSFWVPLDPVSAEVCPHFFAGSHLDGVLYRPRYFKDGADYGYDYGDDRYVPVPDLDAAVVEDPAARARLRSWDLQPGDAVAFHFRTLHNAPANAKMGAEGTRRRAVSFRCFGDDAIYADRPGRPSPPYPDMGLQLSPGDKLPETWFPKIYQAEP